MRVEEIGLDQLVAPFPWFGCKRVVADEVWSRLGNVTNYVEPFFGSGAVLLARPHQGKTETCNDKDRFVANFWRAARADPEAVAAWIDWPVNEADLTARHLWLLNEGAARIARCDGDPDFYDAQVAGWWCWGACAWIGGGWCSGNGPWWWDGEAWANRQLPHMGNAGQGVNRKLPHMGNGRGAVLAWIEALAERLRRVRVACGDWSRVCGPSVTHRHGLTGVFLDPPYSDTAGRTADIYATDSLTVAHDAREWAIAEGQNPLMRIAFCGYEGEHVFPSDWTAWAWKAHGGFGSQGDGKGRANSGRERIWFSPHCLAPDQGDMFRDAVAS
jgi:DNA adenine methylase